MCTGNVCRSPQAAGLLRARLPLLLGPDVTDLLTIESAGTRGLEGSPLDDQAAGEAVRMGVFDVDAHRARQLTRSLVERADLVLGLERAHRGAAVELDPSANRRAFTLTEFAAVLETLVPAQDVPVPGHGAVLQAFLADVVAAATAARGGVAASQSINYDIEDPYQRETRAYRRSAGAIEAAVDSIVRRLGALAGS
nr:low molecular weight phosphatase family protein [Pseudactinotalea suaedae]